MVAYLKNQNASLKKVTSYKRANGKKQNLEHLYIISLKAWVYISENQ